MKKLLLALSAISFSITTAWGQVTTEPTLLQEDSQSVTVYYHADEGNKALMGLAPTAEVYAHTGVLTNSSTSDSDWKYAPEWLDNDPKYRLTYVSEDLWRLDIGDIREYYGITDASEMVKKLAFVFRDAGGKKQGKTEANGDIFVDVLESGLQIIVDFGIDGTVVTEENNTLNISVATTEAADITLKLGSDVIATATDAKLLTTTYTLPEPGNYIFGVTAETATETKNYAARIYYAESSPEAPYPGEKMEFGAVRNEDGTVTFCLAAPGKHGVNLVGSWDDFEVLDSNLMNRCEDEDGRYFWLTVDGLDDGKQYMYYYYVDGQTRVGDPYARLILDPSNDKYISSSVYPDLPEFPSKAGNVCVAIYQSGFEDFDWQVEDFTPAPTQDLIIYELLLRDFTGTEGKALGNGTVRQAIEKIPYLKSLGVNAVELLPITEFNGNNSWGYNPNFYFAPDKAYGTPADYKEFIDKCHQEGIAVILDMVFNQSDWQHPWYRLYNTGSNPFYNASAPHAYSVLNDWNQGHPLVKRQWDDCVQYWLTEYKVDGFRFDLVKGLGDNLSYPNNGDSGTNAFNQSRIDNMRRIQKAMDAVKPGAIFINENLAGAEEENAMAETGQLNWANINNAGCQFAMGISSNSNFRPFYAPWNSRTWGSTVSYLESHDEERLAYKQIAYGVEAIKDNLDARMQRLGSAAAQMLLCPGAHMIWEFSEMGNEQTTKSSNGSNNTDPKKVCWDLLEEPARAALVENYSLLINCRDANRDLFAEDAEFTAQIAAANWNNGRTIANVKGDKALYTFINPTVNNEITFDFDFPVKDQNYYNVVTHSYGATFDWDIAAGKVTVPANCFITFASGAVSGICSPEATADTTLRVVARDGILRATSASRSAIEIFTLDGRHAATLHGEGEVRLPKGVYMVRSGRETAKVIL